MKTDISSTSTTKPICNFVIPVSVDDLQSDFHSDSDSYAPEVIVPDARVLNFNAIIIVIKTSLTLLPRFGAAMLLDE